ncbi:MAG: ABC transporter permease [Solirubrobacteraceae bacterium]
MSPRPWLAFVALCRRDLHVFLRVEPLDFIAQALLSPVFLLLVFGRVLPAVGAADGDYSADLLPGVLAITLVMTALQGAATPLISELAVTRDLDDRLLSPIPVWGVAVQKLVVASVRGCVAAAAVLPAAALILPGGLQAAAIAPAGLVAVMACGALTGAALGLVMGTVVPAQRITLVFATVLTPLMFSGATFVSYSSLDALPWFQAVALANPVTYVSEAVRAVTTTGPHLGTGPIVLGLAASIAIFGAWGLRGFQRRAIC